MIVFCLSFCTCVAPEASTDASTKIDPQMNHENGQGSGFIESKIDFKGDEKSDGVEVEDILAQLWDVSESPMFAAALIEVVDACFRIVVEQLRVNVFSPDSQGQEASWLPMKTPPLASLLPQLKAASFLLLPNSPKQSPMTIDANIRSIISGHVLDSLCMSVFDAEPAD